MNRLSLNMVFALLIVLGFFQSCNDNKNEDPTGFSRVQLKLIDAPGDYLEVNVEITDIQYNIEDDGESWTSFETDNEYPLNIDLTELIAGNSLLLADEFLPAGIKPQIRLILGENNSLKIEGQEDLIPLETPSAEQSGLKLLLDEELQEGFTYSFILDWNVQESVVEAGNSGIYILKPVIKVNSEVNSGSISGQVIETVEDNTVPISDVSIGVFDLEGEPVTDTITNDNGDFLVQGLSAGTYQLQIAVEGYEDYQSSPLEVTVGEVLDAGTIEITLSE